MAMAFTLGGGGPKRFARYISTSNAMNDQNA